MPVGATSPPVLERVEVEVEVSDASSGFPRVYRYTQVYFDVFISIYRLHSYQTCILYLTF